MLSIGEIVHCDFSKYANLARWYDTMKARPNWSKTHEVFYAMVGALKDKVFEAA